MSQLPKLAPKALLDLAAKYTKNVEILKELNVPAEKDPLDSLSSDDITNIMELVDYINSLPEDELVGLGHTEHVETTVLVPVIGGSSLEDTFLEQRPVTNCWQLTALQLQTDDIKKSNPEISSLNLTADDLCRLHARVEHDKAGNKDGVQILPVFKVDEQNQQLQQSQPQQILNLLR